MLEILRLILFALVALFVLVTVHEFGHYWVARRCGVRVLRFSIGFGKPLLSYRRGDTDFVFAGIPLGGYVKMYGEQNPEEEPIPEDQQVFSFSHKNVWQRMAIVVAGPLANMVLAVLLYTLVFWGGLTGIAPVVGSITPESPAHRAGLETGAEILAVDGRATDTWSRVYDLLVRRIGETGAIRLTARHPQSNQTTDYELSIESWQADTAEPDLLNSLGFSPWRPPIQPIVGEVVSGSAAEQAGFMSGDEVLSVDGLPLADWESWRSYIRARPNQPIETLVVREGERRSLVLTPDSVEEGEATIGLAGIAPRAPEWPQELLRDQHYGVFGSMQQAAVKTWDTTGLILMSLKKLLTGMLSTKSIGGPISIAQYAGASADAGWQSFLMFMAALSVMLGVVNLLPIPVLDGGHLLFYLVELVKGSPLNEAIQGAAMRFGMVFLFGVMLLALYNDFARL